MFSQHIQHNRRVTFILGLLLITAFSFALKPVQASDPVSVIVEVVPGADIHAIAANHNATVAATLTQLNLTRMISNDVNVASALLQDGQVVAVQEDKVLLGQPRVIGALSSELDAQPRVIGALGDPSTTFATQWSVEKIRLAEAHSVAQGADVTVAVLDTGILHDHELFNGKLVPGYDFVDEDDDPTEMADGLDQNGDGTPDQDAGHGTHVAGVVLLTAPEAKIMPLRIFDDEGEGSYFAAMSAIVFAVDNGADIINLSGSGPDNVSFLANAINYAKDRGVVFVAAGGVNSLGYPAMYDSVISVGAADSEDIITDFSDFTAMANTVYAPGTSIFSGYYNGDYAWWTGNSMATPFVAGTAALMMSTGTCDAACVRTNLQNTAHAVIVDPSTQNRYGRIDAYDAVATAAQQTELQLAAQLRIPTEYDPMDQSVQPFIQINNQGNSVPLNELTLRYWYTPEGASPEVAVCDYAVIGCENVQLSVVDNVQGHFLEVGFTANAGQIYGGQTIADLQLRVHKEDWSLYDETNDYSVATSPDYQNWDAVTLYHNNSLVWGQEPNSAAPTPPLPDTNTSLHATYHTFDNAPLNKEAKPIIDLVNNSGSTINLENIAIRYWTNDAQTAVLQTHCDYVSINCNHVNMITTPAYVEISFNAAAGELPINASLNGIQLRFNHNDWSTYDETDDYSYDSSINSPATAVKITVYQNGNLIWGIEP